MKRVFGLFGAVVFAVASAFNVNAGITILLNEIEVDPPVQVGDRCQYVELRGMPDQTIPSGFWFVSINSDQDNFGFLNAAVPLEGMQFGSNGILVLDNTNGGDCPNRMYDVAASVETYYHQLTLGKGSEGFYVVFTDLTLVPGTDLDANNNGVVDIFDPLAKSLTGSTFQFLDGFNLNYNPVEHYTYGPGPNLVENLLGDVPDAATRFPDNTTPNSAAAWYSGELADSPEETLEYGSPVSGNAPQGASLTPGAPNEAAAPGTAVFDFDGDGQTDVSVFRRNPSSFAPNRGPEGSTSQWWILNSSNSSNYAAAFGQPDDIAVPADYTGDGRADIAFYRPSTSQWFILRSEDQSFFAFPFGASGDIAAPGDFDGDGKADPAVFRPGNATWFILRSSDGQTATVQFGVAEDLPTVADFDGDGMDDIAVFRPSVSQWWQLRSSAGTIAYAFGETGDTTAVGDYTGDGKADVAFFRPSNSTWYVLRSEDSSFFAFPFGTAGDVAAPGDYDGDGKTDAAVFRESNLTWFILGSTSGFEAVQFGSAGDQPVPSVFSRTAP